MPARICLDCLKDDTEVEFTERATNRCKVHAKALRLRSYKRKGLQRVAHKVHTNDTRLNK